MSDELHNEIQNALRHNQYLVKVPNSPSTPLIAVSGHCIITGVTWQTDGFSEEVLFKGLRLWAMGQLAQSALHFMSAEEREFLISGISPEGWAATFPEEPGDREPFFPISTEEETWQCEGCAQVLPAKDMFEAADAPSGEVFRFCNRCYHNNP